MATSSPKTEPQKKGHKIRKLVSLAMVAGADYAGNRMMTAESTAAPKKKGHKMQKLMGLAMVAGAAYATKKIIQSRKK